MAILALHPLRTHSIQTGKFFNFSADILNEKLLT